jgi:RND family efflux transporter MFP subunit
MTFPPPEKPASPPGRRKGKTGTFLFIVLVAVLAGGAGIFLRMHESSALKRETNDTAIPDVVVMKAPQGRASEEVMLPGNVQAWHEAPIYARTNGYLKQWATDIGAHVKKDDPIADIETPEIDAQLRQAEADFKTAEANDKLAQSTAARWGKLLKTGSVSRQDADDKISAAESSAAAMASAQANVNRLRDLESFKHITAPFDGIITARNTDTGALIDAGSTGTGPELFHIAETDKLRVYVRVPQTYTSAITPDLTAVLTFAEHPGKSYPAKLTHTADALDASTRTLLIELEVDNENGELLPGGYAETHFKLPGSATSIILPVNTLLFRAQGLQVATIDANGNAVLKSIAIGRDYGKEVEVVSGVSPGETIIVNPPDSLITGQHVRVVTPHQDKQSDAKNGDKDSGGDDKK